jgi:metallo-beta-lactamase family protein
MRITFLGATDTVTGSRFLVESDSGRLLVDCGLFQGLKKLRLRNRERFPVDPAALHGIVLTHAHLDHSGYFPLLYRNGFAGRAWCTPATLALCGILLPDSGYLQEEEAAYANKEGFSRHSPARPLYTQRDAEESLAALHGVPFAQEFHPAPSFSARFGQAGHILGAAWVWLSDGKRSVVFSGDVGRPNDPVMNVPEPIPPADCLVVESTYGDRRHAATDPADTLADIIDATAARGGTILIPSFAVGRAQVLLHLLAGLVRARRIPRLPVYLDSPMAINATELFIGHHALHRLSAEDCRRMGALATYTRTAAESKAAMNRRGPKIIISASGMATGGRVLHHLKRCLPDPSSSIVFVGYQAAGTRGAALLAGAESIKIHGEYHRVRAHVEHIDGLSAHADAAELIDWLKQAEQAPKRTYIVHGEPSAQDALRRRLRDELGWEARIPEYRGTEELP